MIYVDLTDTLMSLQDNTEVYHDPRAVAAVLDYHARRAAMQKGGQ